MRTPIAVLCMSPEKPRLLCLTIACNTQVVHVDTAVLRGDPKYEIEEWVRGRPIDNVVLSRRGGEDKESTDVGGVSDYLVSKLSTNVLVIRYARSCM